MLDIPIIVQYLHTTTLHLVFVITLKNFCLDFNTTYLTRLCSISCLWILNWVSILMIVSFISPLLPRTRHCSPSQIYI
jgi:hypothetical protein